MNLIPSDTYNHSSGLELIASKWAHSLIELDLAWANVQDPLDNAIKAIAEKGDESPLKYVHFEQNPIQCLINRIEWIVFI